VRGKSKKNYFYWLCKCDCGKEATVIRNNLKSGATQSCGCLAKEHRRGVQPGNKLTFHGYANTKVYSAWRDMVHRCHNSKCRSYKGYGALGITVCKRWRTSFVNFLADMGLPQPNESIDRIKPEKGYTPSNCRWLDFDKNKARARKYRGKNTPSR
jgi:hypothetical protein